MSSWAVLAGVAGGILLGWWLFEGRYRGLQKGDLQPLADSIGPLDSATKDFFKSIAGVLGDAGTVLDRVDQNVTYNDLGTKEALANEAAALSQIRLVLLTKASTP